MVGLHIGANAGPGVVVETWRAQYRRRLEVESDPRVLQRLHRFGTWPAILIDFILLVVAEIVLSVALAALIPVVIGVHDNDFSRPNGFSTAASSTKDWLESPIGLAFSAFATDAVIAGFLYFRIVRRRILSWGELGFGAALWLRPARAVLVGVGTGLCAYVLAGIVLFLLQKIGLNVSGQESTLDPIKHAPAATFAVDVVALSLSAPIAEEAFFRAYLFRALAVRYRVLASIIVSAAFFGVLHTLGMVTWEFLAIGCAGAVFAVAYARTGNLLTNISAHMCFNAIGVILLRSN